MKIPKIFVPDKNQDEKVKNLIRDRKSRKTRRIDTIESLACLPEKIGNYYLRTEFEKINKKDWTWHFEEHIPEYLIQAADVTYQTPSSDVFTRIYILEFKSETNLSKLNEKINLEKEINKIDAMITKCLKKDKYLVAIKANKTDKEGLDIIRNWYLNNFELDVL